MKKIISLIMACALIASMAFAYDGKISYDAPSKEISDKIMNAVNDKLSAALEWSGRPEETEYRVIAQFGDNYFIRYYIVGWLMDCPQIYKAYGDYCIISERYVYEGVYVSADDKVISMDEAYNEGIMTQSIIGEIIAHYNESTSIGAKIGDMNFDNVIDIVDLAKLRREVIYFDPHYDPKYSEFNRIADINKDDTIDIGDVVMMRSKIIQNGN